MALEQLVDVGVDSNSIRPENYNSLAQDQRDFIDRLDSFEAPYLQEKLLEKEVFKTEGDYKEAFTEFKKYVALVGLHGNNIAMTSKRVDEVWHQFILFTKKYNTFCGETLGEYLHHTPKTSHTPLRKDGRDNFIKFYRENYGELPNIWQGGSLGDCDPEGCAPEGWCNPDSDG